MTWPAPAPYFHPLFFNFSDSSSLGEVHNIYFPPFRKGGGVWGIRTIHSISLLSILQSLSIPEDQKLALDSGNQCFLGLSETTLVSQIICLFPWKDESKRGRTSREHLGRTSKLKFDRKQYFHSNYPYTYI